MAELRDIAFARTEKKNTHTYTRRRGRKVLETKRKRKRRRRGRRRTKREERREVRWRREVGRRFSSRKLAKWNGAPLGLCVPRTYTIYEILFTSAFCSLLVTHTHTQHVYTHIQEPVSFPFRCEKCTRANKSWEIRSVWPTFLRRGWQCYRGDDDDEIHLVLPLLTGACRQGWVVCQCRTVYTIGSDSIFHGNWFWRSMLTKPIMQAVYFFYSLTDFPDQSCETIRTIYPFLSL